MCAALTVDESVVPNVVLLSRYPMRVDIDGRSPRARSFRITALREALLVTRLE